MAGSQLLGRFAIVTGAASGIGKAVSTLFAKEGCTVALLDKSEEIYEVAKQLRSQYADVKHFAHTIDVSSGSDVRNTLKVVADEFKTPPSILVNSAGITEDQTLLKMSEDKFDKVIAVNLKGTYLASQELARMIKEYKVQNGSIVNLSSISGKTGNIGQANYSASKAGVIGLTKTCAKELARYGIRCNAVLPGFIDTPMTGQVPENVIEMVKAFIPLQRMGTPEEVAEVCLFLASTRSRYITGASIEVTGGLFM